MGKRLAVFGAGAIGGQVGARMFAAGHDVTLIEPWPEQFRAIRDSGLRIEDENGPVLVRPPVVRPDRLHLLDPVDILFLAVKSYDSDAAVERILPRLSPQAWVVSTQNGINEEIIAQRIESGRILGVVILINAVLEAPGRIQVSTQSVSRSSNLNAPGAYVGEYAGSSDSKAQEVAPISECRVAGEDHPRSDGHALDQAGHQCHGQRAFGNHRSSVSPTPG